VQQGFKIAIGGGAAALLAILVHGPLGMGGKFVAHLQVRAYMALAEAGVLSDLRVKFPADPLSRTALLGGTAPEEERNLAIAAVSRIAGVSAVRPETQAPPAQRVAAAVVRPPRGTLPCEDALDKAMAGRALTFRSGSAYLSPQSNRIIRDVADALRQCPGLRVEIGGHGDASGSAAINQSMSDERAKRVRDALVIRGVSPDALSVRGYGAARPVDAANAMNQANRRVTYSVGNGGT
jgi:OOP family OmpA-OmpF porin